MLNVEGFREKVGSCKGFTAFNIIQDILKAAVPTPTKEELGGAVSPLPYRPSKYDPIRPAIIQDIQFPNI